MAENNTKRGPGHGPGGPRGGFRKPKDLRGTLSKLMGYLGRYKALLVIVVILLFISAACSVAGSYLIKPLINDYILPGDFIGLAKMLCVMAGVYVVGAVCSYGYARIMVHVAQNTVAKLRADLFNKMQKLPLKFFDTHTHGELMSRYTNDIETVSEALNNSFASLISCSLTFVGTVVMMIVLSPILTAITAVMLGVMLLVVKTIGGRSRRYFAAQQKAIGAVNGYIEEMIEGQKDVYKRQGVFGGGQGDDVGPLGKGAGGAVGDDIDLAADVHRALHQLPGAGEGGRVGEDGDEGAQGGGLLGEVVDVAPVLAVVPGDEATEELHHLGLAKDGGGAALPVGDKVEGAAVLQVLGGGEAGLLHCGQGGGRLVEMRGDAGGELLVGEKMCIRDSNGGGGWGYLLPAGFLLTGGGKDVGDWNPCCRQTTGQATPRSLPKRGGGADLRGREGLWRQESSDVFNRGRFWRRGERRFVRRTQRQAVPPCRWRGGPADDKGTFGEGRVHRVSVGRGARRALAGRDCQRRPWVRR